MHWAIGAIALLVFVSAITPGPNNLIVLGRASAHGAAAVIPTVSGIVAGGIVMIALTQAGLGALVAGNVWALRTITLGGAAYLAWLGVSMIRNARVASDAPASATSRVSGALALFAFQFVNPKAWLLVLTAVSAATAEHVSVAMLVALFAVISFASLSAWALLGQTMQRWHRQPRLRVWFDRVMGVLLIASTLILIGGV